MLKNVVVLAAAHLLLPATLILVDNVLTGSDDPGVRMPKGVEPA
jgi:hypothetical protein